MREPPPPRPKPQSYRTHQTSKEAASLGFLGGRAKVRRPVPLSALLPAFLARERERICEGKPYGFPSRSINPPQRQILALCQNLLGLGTGSPDPVARGGETPVPSSRGNRAKNGTVPSRGTLLFHLPPTNRIPLHRAENPLLHLGKLPLQRDDHPFHLLPLGVAVGRTGVLHHR